MNNNSKRKKIDKQSLVVTVVVILMMVAIVTAIAVSLAKSKSIIEKTLETATGNNADVIDSEEGFNASLENDETEDVFLNDNIPTGKETINDKETEIPVESTVENTDKVEDTDAADTLPEFSAPVNGEIIKEASLETPVFSQTMEDYRTHSGVDVFCRNGESVLAAADGKIKEIWDDPLMGTCLSIEHSGGAVTTYKGLCDDIPSGIIAGKEVKRGDVIATSSDTALIEIAEDSHLHFELSIDGKNVDPCDYITFSQTNTYED